MVRRRHYPTIIIVVGLFLISLAMYVGTSFDASANLTISTEQEQTETIPAAETIENKSIPPISPQPVRQPAIETISVMSAQ